VKKIGLLGGMAWPSTIDYYRAICTGANAWHKTRGVGASLPVPKITICHAAIDDPDETVVLLAWTELPLAFPENIDDAVFKAEGFTFVNTAAAHVAAILGFALGDDCL